MFHLFHLVDHTLLLHNLTQFNSCVGWRTLLEVANSAYAVKTLNFANCRMFLRWFLPYAGAELATSSSGIQTTLPLTSLRQRTLSAGDPKEMNVNELSK